MSFFQNSVLNKHLKTLNKEDVSAAYSKFKAYFHNPEIQQNIREAKEEQFQEGFLRELFVEILGYTLNPQPDYNLTTEFKNEVGAKKADGAILMDSKALAVIELKGTDTKDLDKVNRQAFDYKNNQSSCVYVITSNFEKLRFFIENSVDHIEFNLFTLKEEEFELLWLCLHVDNILGGLPLKIKEQSLLADENITKQLYKDYSSFKYELWQNIAKNLPGNDQLLLFKKTQKLLDRFLFIFFAEDSGLLPPNSISRIVERWQILKEEDAYKPLYEIFQQYFGYINSGRKGKTPQDDIFAYNGGLFIEDIVLDNIIIDDDVLHKHVMKLTTYYFQSEVNVNILGHIFENSLTEIENVTAKLEGQKIDKSKTKRKKDGVFYTPKYITKYIVDNTVGKLCDEKKLELKIVDEEYAKGRRNRNKSTIKKLDQNLQSYRDWLLEITICDPACGSGAFLNQALEFLIDEHVYIDELYAQLHGASIVFQDVSNHILEKNLFGVDINEESIEIAKLSLWLRTAQRGRKLTTLSNNIKCGNSLIDDPEVAGEKAFNWQKEFSIVFDKSGFDVVIGNPPYVRVQNLSSDDVDYYFTNYQTPIGKLDLSILFFEKSFDLINPKGAISFISSSQWMQTDYGKNIRNIIIESILLEEIVDFGTLPVFQDASTYPAIFSFSKVHKETFRVKSISKKQHLNIESIYSTPNKSVSYKTIDNGAWSFGGFNLMTHLEKNKIKWQKLNNYGKAYYGVVTGMDKAFIVTDEMVRLEKLEKEIIIPYAYKGEEVNRYEITEPSQLTIYPYKKGVNGDSILLTEQELKTKYPNIYNYLSKFRIELEERKDSRKLYATGDNWFRNVRQGNFNLIEAEKIQIRGIGKRAMAGSLSNNTCFSGANCPAIILDDSALSSHSCLALLNSALITYYLNSVCPKKLGGYIRYNTKNISLIPIVIFNEELEEKAAKLVSEILSTNKALAGLNDTFQKYLQSQFSINKLPKKLQNWHELEYRDFIKELNKAIKKAGGEKLSKIDEMEWMGVFEAKKAEAQNLKVEIDKTDAEIDAMVYELYGLSEEEIKIVEGS